MLVAQNENRELINLLDEMPDSGQRFFCPACKSEVRLKCGLVKIPHFAHISLNSCHSWTENESAEHLGLKKELFAWAVSDAKVEVEKYLPELGQTPDLLINDKIAIEVQCSRLSVKRLWERTLNYRNNGYVVFWLMGNSLQLGKTLNPLQKDLLYYSENRGFHYWELDIKRSCLRLKYLIHQNLHGQLAYLTEEFSFGGQEFLEILKKPYSAQILKELKVSNDKEIHKYIRRQLYHRTLYWMRLQSRYYSEGKSILNEKFSRQWMPPGLDILTRQNTSRFCQITQDIASYYQNFLKYSTENLYPPRYYAIINQKKR
ncbi:MAG: competence protein CoiA [Streptococcaceae bacterium]|jgi:competence protein CoiA|nr:competence protein CoiA [Streptococcaceae bacterium]